VNTDVPITPPATDSTTVQRRLSTILVADVVGYSRLMSEDDEGTLRALQACRRIFEAEIALHHGRIFGGAGDSVLAEFASPIDGLRCAWSLQERLARGDAEVGGAPRLRYRMGINLGDVIVAGDDLLGDGVNVASRLEALSEPGGIALAGSVVDQVEGRLPLRFVLLGDYRFKNLPRPVRVYRVVDGSRPAGQPDDEAAAAEEGHALPSVALLPFANLGADEAHAIFADGLVEDIIARLSRFRELVVIARSSSFAYRGRTITPEQAGQELGVRYVLDGSVRSAGSLVRITAQLIEVATGRRVWAERYDRDVADLFAVQDEVTQLIAATLISRVGDVEMERGRIAHTEDMEAYAAFVRARMLIYTLEKPANGEAQRLLQQVIQRDPHFSRAFGSLALTHLHEWRYGWVEDGEAALRQAKRRAREAVALDDLNPRGHAALGYVHFFTGNPELAVAEYERALRINPNDPDIMAEYADVLNYTGRPDLALRFIEQAKRLNPRVPDWYLWYEGDVLFSLGRYEEAIATLERMRDPSQGRRLLAASCALLGREAEARAHAEEVLRTIPGFTIAAWAAKLPSQDHAILGRLVEGLRRAGLPE
jgi:TolB-like protein/class 3 adenylate cyclase/tetratricopeptide (TPR) repeat protein